MMWSDSESKTAADDPRRFLFCKGDTLFVFAMEILSHFGLCKLNP